MKVLAGAMFVNGMRRLRESEKRAQPVPAQYLGENHLEENHVDQIMRCV